MNRLESGEIRIFSKVVMLGRFGASLGLLRPRTLARTQKSVDKLLGDTQESRRALKQLAAGQAQLQAASEDVLARLESLAGEMRSLQQQVSALTLRESQLRAVMRADAATEYAMARVASVCDEKRIASPTARVIEGAELYLETFPLILVPDAFRLISTSGACGHSPVNCSGQPFTSHTSNAVSHAPAYTVRGETSLLPLPRKT